MLRKSLLMTAICVSSVTLTGCSTLQTSWNSMNDMFAGVSGVVKTAFLRGSSDKSDISFAENSETTEDGVLKTDVGEYIPTDVKTEIVEAKVVEQIEAVDIEELPKTEMTEAKSITVELFDTPLDPVDTSAVPCPDGTYLAEDKSCMSLESGTYDFPDVVTEATVVDTSPVPCPEGTFLNDENACILLETKTVDFAAETPAAAPAKEFKPDFALNVPSPEAPIDCPEGFAPNGKNACMFLGEGTQSGN